MASRVDAVCVDPEQIGEVWPTVAPMIDRAVSKTGGSFAEIEGAVFDSQAQLWLAWDGTEILAVAVTRLYSDVCEIWACGGRGLLLWRDLIKRLEDFGRAEGKARMRIIGRKGWARVLRDYWSPSIILEKRL
jgi:hypothetical protein